MALPPHSGPPAASEAPAHRPSHPEPTTEGFVRGALAHAVARGAADESSKAEQAFLHWRLGTLTARGGDPASAVKSWLTAYNLAPGFRAPLLDLVRLFERRRSFKNLQRLYEAELKGAGTPAERASARMDLACLFEDRDGRVEDALAELVTALDDAGESAEARATVGLLLERMARRAGRPDLARRALRAQVDASSDPVWRTLLLIDLAEDLSASGASDDVRAAFAALDEALATGAARQRALTALERLARRHDEVDALIRALDGLAELASRAARGEPESSSTASGGEPESSSDAFDGERFADSAHAAVRAASSWLEAAGLAMHRVARPADAVAHLQSALTLRPDDAFLRELLVEAAAAAGDHAMVLRETTALLEAASAEGEPAEHQVPARLAVGLLFHAARAARAEQDPRALDLVTRALQLAPGSFVLRALMDRWLLEDERFDRWVEALTEREHDDDEDRALTLWHAATLAELALNDGSRARELLARAAERAASPGPVLRQLLESALADGDDEAANDAIAALVASELPPGERSALLRDRVLLLSRGGAGSEERLQAALDHALGAPEAATWAPDEVRVRSAKQGRHAALARAHAALATLADDDEHAAGHLAAAGRALVLAGDHERAERVLREALGRAPGHRYAAALLEDVYRARGDADAVVSLLREVADAHGGTQTAVVELVLAGAAAESSGDAKLAAESYAAAAERQPEAYAPAWALERLARETGDDELLQRTLERQSERELADGVAGRATLELGEHYLRLGKTEVVESPLRACLEGSFALEAAAALVTVPTDRVDPSARIGALEVLLQEASGADAQALRRELGLVAATGELDPELATRASDSLLEGVDEGGDVWALLQQLHLAGVERRWADRADLYLRLAEATEAPEARASLTLHGLRAKVLADAATADDAFLLAQELVSEEDSGSAAAVAADETLEGGDDPDARAEALLGRLAHADTQAVASLEAAAGRALGAARRTDEALAKLEATVAADPSDLASWEALRLVAREAGAWSRVVEACGVLAPLLDGDLRFELHEEAAAVCMDHLGRPEEAKTLLEEVVLADPTRPNAFHRMHDLLADEENTEALLALVSARIEAIDDCSQLERLLYEQARLHRSLSQLDEALSAIDELLLLDEQHVGAIALAVEIHAQREEWQDAVEALRRLTCADIPAKQKRIAHLGAADFLENKLGDPVGALTELAAIDALGLADAALHERRAEIASRAGDPKAAADALLRSAALSTDADGLDRMKRAARMLTSTGDQGPALLAWRRAIELAPTDIEAGAAIVELLDGPDRVTHSQRYELALRHRMSVEGVDADALRCLRAAARWRADGSLELAALHALAGLGLATAEEKAALDEAAAESTPGALGTLTQGQLGLLRAPSDGGPELELARLVQEELLEVVELDLGQLGVGRHDVVSSRSPSTLRDELVGHARSFGSEVEELYVGGNDPERLLVLPGRKGGIWIAGGSVVSPMDPLRRFLAGQQSYALQRGIVPLLRRPPEDAAMLLAAACAASEAPLPAAAGRSVVPELAGRLARSLPRRTRKAVQQLAPALPEGGAKLVEFCRDARRSAMRAGLLLSGDLVAVLEALLAGPLLFSTIRRSADAADLLDYWLSPAMQELRRGLGA